MRFDARHILSLAMAQTLRKLESEHAPYGNTFAVRKTIRIGCRRLQAVSEGVAQIKQCPLTVLVLVACHNAGFHLT